MSEVRKIETKSIDQRCPVCRIGWMRPTGIVNQTNPPSYEHSCISCGHKETYGLRYPYTV